MSAPTSSPTAPNGLAAVLLLVRRQPRRNLLLVALLPVLVTMWLPLLGGSKNGAAVAAPPPPLAAAPMGETAASAGAPATTVTAVAPPSLATFAQQLQTLTAPFEPRWSPTLDPRPFRTTLPNGATDAPISGAPTYEPSAILLSRHAPPVAIVQGRAHQIGDRIGVRTIVGIDEQRVVYREGEVTIPVALPQPQLGGHR